jgi:hypothetical protein
MEPLGSGGMGRVWKARDEVLRRDVAIKEVNLPQELSPAERDELRIRTLREARTAARLSHPNVVQIYDVLGIDDHPWIVMEYIRSRSLQQILTTDGPVSPKRAARIGLAVLRALVAAHRAGVLHRDVKPGNVLIAEDGRVVLTDFGLATFDGGEGAVTRPGLVWGSPEYVAPERAKHGLSSVETDLWSLGATLFAAVEGSSPYARPSAMATLTALAVEKPPVPQRAGPLKPVLTGLLRKDPRARLRPQELEKMLRRVADPEGRGRVRRLPRQRPAPAAEAAAPAPTDEAEGTAVVPIRSYSLPEPPTEVIRTDADDMPPERQLMPSRRAWLIALGTVLVLALVTVGTVYLTADRRSGSTGSGGGGAAASARASTTPAAPAATASVVPSSEPLPGENALPAGWAYYREAGQFRVAVPVGWVIERTGRVVLFREPFTLTHLSVEVWGAEPKGALANTQELHRSWSTGGTGSPPNYKLIRLDPVVIGDGGAEWEYNFSDSQTATPMQVLTRRFNSGGRCFAIAWTGPVYDSASRRSFFDLAVAGFSSRSS